VRSQADYFDDTPDEKIPKDNVQPAGGIELPGRYYSQD
jgi:hypothetical protein